MKIEIVLKDPRYCNGCPCCDDEDVVVDCTLFENSVCYKNDDIPYHRLSECREKYGD
jgi:uncharacterized protein (UPF0248 family)